MHITEIKDGSVTSPLGFLASGMRAGIKKSKRKFDSSLIFSAAPAISAGVFTTNKAKAWPLLYNESILSRSTHRAILANSGNANCFNGEIGRKTVQASVKLAAAKLKVKQQDVLVASTGIIGKAFPLEKFKAAIPVLVKKLSQAGGLDAAKGILTTDTVEKQMAVQFHIGGKLVTMGAMAKGAGMVYPHMVLPGKRHATMLCFVTTDLAISKSMLRRALDGAVQKTFNNIAIDNDISTNDMVLVLANGVAGNVRITGPGQSLDLVEAAMTHLFAYLSREMVKDGEGVQHVCEIRVKGARSQAEARKAASQIGTSMLVKTMFAGEDPNWGRVVAAVGASQVSFSKQLDISFDGIYILKNGKELTRNRSKTRLVLKKKMFVLQVDLKKGPFEETFLTTDLTKFYVWINSAYST
ncbi:MAG: bifunctional ornithine acetyltransferase/N-acetylglutamate synthase [Candidatus Omnitrophica bacterium CG11_big_fil_rev_8_21_14_0_20_45_26]|uniref:Arginine biosynthesis bifunctional protein ArgJ n=1 Tax=Candidatus Abzuiibacterium crystallinum TaxID=1974748 RepID=A0A2H0LSW9_9BACT|nr:MAG: bifunctional ornithine acetyltransferase/N-acetylglutamate synthase [Candidatus Omnitrophica bacterium CG11_big_fil_rev_8_21_14_0_20_45_26]PIW63383.1 MAG: hypothetical protein COW12_10660 [Candidatus Omnitrophica bacterium CG12_big_fil_rev_8_21_14_0_65_45_16]